MTHSHAKTQTKIHVLNDNFKKGTAPKSVTKKKQVLLKYLKYQCVVFSKKASNRELSSEKAVTSARLGNTYACIYTLPFTLVYAHLTVNKKKALRSGRKETKNKHTHTRANRTRTDTLVE